MSTKYKLLKDLPNVDAGEDIIRNPSTVGYMCPDKFGGIATFAKALIENNPAWFELVNEGVEITELEISHYHRREKGNAYHFSSSIDIPKDKLPLIKEAISKCLNEVDKVDDTEFMVKRRYNLQEVNELQRKAFGAGRFKILDALAFTTFEDYLKTIQ